MKRKTLDPLFKRVLMLALESLKSPFSLSLFIKLRDGDYDGLVSSSVDPRNYLDTVSGIWAYYVDAQALALVKKIEGLPTSFSTKVVAEGSFFDYELLCADTNYRIQTVTSGLHQFSGVDLGPFEAFLRRVKNVVGRILGPVPPSVRGRFGPGTTFELEDSTFSTVADKVCSKEPAVTRAAESYFRLDYDNTLWGLCRAREGLPYMQFVRGNRFTTVPKDGKTDRGICIEPVGNLWIQLGLGDYMKRRLKLVGIDVSRSVPRDDPLTKLQTSVPVTGQTIHRNWAQVASTDGKYATIDLKAASDTLSYQLVRHVLPEDWFHLLNDVRSPFTSIKKKWVKLEKFSSMGNGFTFELETLIFTAIISAVTDLIPGKEYSVYGDDIIVPTPYVRDVLAALSFCGFVANEKKTYTDGYFRESCGGDFFCGFGVRPVYLKKQPDSPLSWMECHNLLARAGFPDHVLRLCRSAVPTSIRFRGPVNTDGVFWTSSRKKYTYAFNRRIRGPYMLWYKRLVPASLRISLDRWSNWSHIVFATIGVPSSGLIPRGDSKGWKIKLASCS